jgi:DENN (AEX-3) domain
MMFCGCASFLTHENNQHTCSPYLFLYCRTIEAITSQQVSIGRTNVVHNGHPQHWFLHQLLVHQQEQQQQLLVAAAPDATMMTPKKPVVATICNLELDDENFSRCDTHRFILPASLLLVNNNNANPNAEEEHNAAIMPLLRCVGISHGLRILSALLSERRLVFCSASPTRLTKCGHAALSLLNAGGLCWHHVFIPVLCPHLTTMLAAPYPYLIGILLSPNNNNASANVLNTVDGVGEVLIVNLDTNTLETRGMSETAVTTRMPDLVLQSNNNGSSNMGAAGLLQQLETDYGGGSGTTTTAALASSSCDVLIQDLSEVLRQDKRLLYGDSALERVGETAAKAKEVVRKTFNKLRDRFQQQVLSAAGGTGGGSGQKSDHGSVAELSQTSDSDNATNDVSSSMTVDGIAMETCHNETAEHEVRIAFCTFFLTFYGDVKWFLSRNPAANGQVALDRKLFCAQKQREYPMPNSPMLQLAQNFCQTQLLEEFAKARIAAIASSSSQQQSPSHNNNNNSNTLLFFQCEQYLR